MKKIKMKLTVAAILLCLAGIVMHAQPTIGSITPVLIGSTGNFSSAAWGSLSASTGEPSVTTTPLSSGYILTQGFQQPSPSSALVLSVNLVFTTTSCVGANDGTASVFPTGGSAPYTYLWQLGPNDSATTASVDSLAPGTYTVTVTDAGGLTVVNTFTIVDNQGICGIHVYSGLTPNGDGHNDLWIIDHIDLFPDNHVYIYDRWGIEVWQGDHYDNSSVVWNGKTKSGTQLPDGTYYYILQVGGQSMKGWVELSNK